MQNLSASVGENGSNARHDVALVQAMLVLAQRPANVDPGRAKYLARIDGDCGNKTKTAIRQFQYDQVFVGPGGNSSRAVPGATAGSVAPGDTSWKKLVSAMVDPLTDLRVLSGSKTVYVAATAAQVAVSIGRVRQLTFEPNFLNQVTALTRRIHDRHGVAVGVCADGDRRDFQTQYELLTNGRNVTRAGPGESNHNFGQAVDLGFANLRWLRVDGSAVDNETSWLHKLDPGQQATGEALLFWNILRSEGTAQRLHRGPLSDRPHLQAWPDAGIDMATRLADLLTRAGRMRWTGRGQRYQCDLGFGGRFFEVGSAAQIWNRQATVTLDMLMQARGQPRAQPPAAQEVSRTGGGGTATTEQGISTMRDALRADFDAADAAWQTWRPR